MKRAFLAFWGASIAFILTYTLGRMRCPDVAGEATAWTGVLVWQWYLALLAASIAGYKSRTKRGPMIFGSALVCATVAAVFIGILIGPAVPESESLGIKAWQLSK